MSLFLEDDCSTNDRPDDTQIRHHHRMSAEFPPESHLPQMPRFVPNSVPLNFGSNTAFQAPPFLLASGPVLPSLASSPPNADSPGSQNTANIPSTIESAFGPETPTPIESQTVPNIFSSGSRSPSISSIPSLRPRSPLANLPHLKIPGSDAPLPVSLHEGSLVQPNDTYPFMPHLPDSVFSKSRSTCTANASTQTDPDEHSIMVTDGMKEFEDVKDENARLKRELAEMRAAYAELRRKVDRHFPVIEEEDTVGQMSYETGT